MEDLRPPDSAGAGGWNTEALDQIMPQVYTELKRLAAYHLKNEKPNHTLSPTAIVHEVYLVLRKQHSLDMHERKYFLQLASSMMRRILVNYAKYRKRQKRGQGISEVPFSEIPEITLIQFEEEKVDVIALEEVLKRLELKDLRMGRIVELRFYGGMTFEEIAELLEISSRTAIRDWHFARTWLYKNLNGGGTK